LISKVAVCNDVIANAERICETQNRLGRVDGVGDGNYIWIETLRHKIVRKRVRWLFRGRASSAAESPLAAQAGVRILEHGGNAVDAAIATNAMMGVVSPMMNGIGGDLFVIVYDAKANKLYGLNASGWAPKNLTPELLKKKGLREMPQTGVNTITVPGAWTDAEAGGQIRP